MRRFSMNILEAVEQKYPSLSRQERKIALKVIQHPSQVKKWASAFSPKSWSQYRDGDAVR